MNGKLLLNAAIKFIAGILLVMIFLFLPAGSLQYWNGWLFMGLLFVPILIMGTVLFIKAPALLEKRLNRREKERTQKGVIGLSGVVFIVGFVAAGVDFRIGWSEVPMWLVIIACVLQVAGYVLFAEVMRENAYLSRAVEVQEGQKVIDTELYGIVRHPMYAAAIILFCSMPLVLGSWVAFVVFLAFPVLLAVRIRNEEDVLKNGLEGYAEYIQKVKYRLFPFIW